MGLTNNEVKFLVTLDIDETKSKTNINNFLTKVTKEQKLTFGVNIGKSNENIKKFIDKQQNKKGKILFDVAVGESNKNISKFFTNSKQQKKSLIFYVNEQATRTSVNSSLKNMKFNKVLIDLAVNTTQSKTNINNFIDTVKLHKKSIVLALDTKNSRLNINKSLEKMILAKPKVKLSLAKDAFDQVKNNVTGKEFTGLKIIGELNVTKTKERIKEQIEKMSLPKFKVDVVAKVNPVISSKTAQQAVNTTPSKNTTSSSDADSVKAYKNKAQAVKELKEEYKKAGKEITVFSGSVKKGEEDFINSLKKQGHQVDIVRDAQTKEITKVTATYKNSANEIQKTVFTPLISQYTTLNAKTSSATKEIRGFVAQVEKIKNTNTFELTKGLEEFNRKLKEVRNTTFMTATTFKEFSDKAKNITSNDQLQKLNNELKDYRLDTERIMKLEKAQNEIRKKRQKLLDNLIRTEKLHRRTVDKNLADEIRAELEKASFNKVLNRNAKRIDINDVLSANKILDETSLKLSRLNANATEATKNSMGIISALKVAMEKFPIWMVASTAFYGSIGTLREFGSIIVDIDKKMTDLKKVMDADTNFDKVFERATQSAETFGKSISETMDAYNMFAKQGFKGDELEDYANAGLVAGNVGDIDAGKASEYLTASVLQWNKSSKDAMGIVDSWNELSNKYATTVENLAQGQAKAGATSKALGMDFNQLNSVIGTLNAKTKQSGNEIGNFVKSVFPRLVSDSGKSVLESLGVDLTDSDGNIRDVIEIYTDVAKAIKNISQEEQIAVVKGLAGTYHISRMQTLLDDLGSAESMYRSMYETAENSQGSAMNENATYMKSLEARINLARVEIEKLALAIGEAFMTEGMIQFLQTFRVILSSITEFVSTFGALPAIFGGIVATLTIFSSRFKGVLESTGKWIEKLKAVEKISNKLSNSTTNSANTNNTANTGNQNANTQNLNNNTNATNKNTQATNANTNSTNKNTKAKKTNATTLKYRGHLIANNTTNTQRNTQATSANTTATNANTKATKALNYSKKALALGFGGLGIATLALGYGLEKLLSHVAEVRQEEEEYQNTLAQSKKAYQDNASSIDKLVVRYKELSSQDIAPDSEEYSELLDVQNELANLLPSLSKGEDAYGNAILQNADIVDQRVKSLKTQVELEERLAELKAKEENEEQVNEALNNADKANKNLEKELKNVGKQMMSSQFRPIAVKVGIEPTLNVKSVEEVIKYIETIDSKLNDKNFVSSLSRNQLSDLEILRDILSKSYDEMMKHSTKLNDNLAVVRSSVANEFEEMIDSAEGLDEDFVEIFTNISNGALSLADSTEGIEGLQDAFDGITANKNLQNEFTNLKTAFDRLKNNAVINSDEIRKTYGKTFSEIKKAILEASNLNPKSEAYKTLKEALDNATDSIIDNEIAIRDKVEAEGISIESARAMVEATASQDGAIEDLTSTMKEYVDNIKKFDSLGEQMLGVNDKLVSETEDLIGVYNYLSNVTNRTADEEAYLTEAMNKLKALYPHLIKNKNLAIDAVIEEQKMNKVLLESYKNMADEKYSSEEEATYYSAVGTKARIENIKKEIEAIQSLYKVEYSKYEALLEKQKNGTLTEKEAMWMYYASQSRGEYTGYAEYIEKMNELDKLSGQLNTSLNKLSSTNSAIAESTDKTSSSTSEAEKVTNKYTLALKKLDTALKEVQARQKKYPTYSSQYRKALEEENKLIQQQIELNKKQSQELGNAQATASSYTTFGTAQPKGWSGAITSNFGKRGNDYHVGIDIDGAIGDILESNVVGKVIQKGYDKISGNYITVQDNDGLKHFYAHLDSISVALNDVVKVGTKLGTIGNTGNVIAGAGGDGSHLHYGVKQGNTWINPYAYVQQAKSGIQTSSTASTKASGGTNQDKVWSYFKSKGLNDKAIAGIMGNIAQESNFNPNAVNSSSGASGIFQWLGSRKTALQNYAKQLGKSWTDLEVQLEFAWKELNSTEKKSLTSLQRGDLSASQHASEFERLFERSGGSAVAKRQSYANQYYNQYQGSGVTTTSYSSSGSSETDDLLAQIESLKQENIELAEKLQENYYKIIQSRLEEFERNRDFEDLAIARQEELQQNMLKHNQAYEDSVNKQYTAEQRKLKNMQQEYEYIQKMLDAGGLTLAQSDALIDKRYELQQLMLESQNQIKEYYNEVIEARLSRYDNQMNDYNKSLTYLETKLQAIDRTTSRYNQTLSLMANNKKAQLTTMKQELEYVNKMLAKGNLTVEMYEELAQRAEDLKNELIETNQALHNLNYEMIQSIVYASDLKLDDIDFEINYSQALRELYEEGSGDYKNALEFELEKLKEKLELIEKKGKDIQEAMKGKDLGTTELQELEEQLEDNKLAYLDVLNAIKDTEEAIKSFTDTVNEQIEDLRSDLADKIIDALKDAIEEAKDIKLDAIEKEIEAEEERHEKVMKQYDDELDAYRKIIDAKRREIDDADRDRTYNNKMEELNNERQEILNKLNLLSNVNTYEGIKEREELQKELAKIEKEIAEEKYQYEKDLREQQLDDMLDEKEESIEDLKDKEDEYSDEVLKNLNKQKEYWEKYYNDLLNDEKYFAKMREDILNGNFDEVESQFKEHIKLLVDSLPELEDKFDGTWQAVGTQIRENVINAMKDLLEEIKKVEEEVDKLNNKKDEITNEFGGVTDENQTVENAGKKEITEADMKVILAKFMNEQIAGSLDPEKDAVRIKNIKDKASQLASEGRAEGSQINANQSLGSIFDSMSSDQLKNLGDYFKNNSSASGFMTQEYLDYILSWGSTAQAGKVMTHGDKQVMLAKYMREYLVPATTNEGTKQALIATSNKIAESGRKNTSLISPSVSYNQALKMLSEKQQAELGKYMLDNATVVGNASLQDMLKKYAQTLMLNSSNDFVGLDTGGMTKGFGSTGGVDGKGGRFALLHQNEITLNPLDSERMLKVSSIMDSVMRTINGAIALPTLSKPQVNNIPTSTDNSTTIHINIEKMNGTQSDIDNLAKQIQNRLLREKGKR